MKKTIPALLLVFALAFMSSGSKPPAQTKNENLAWLQTWFAAWELMSRDRFLLPADSAPLMVFFEKEYVYTTSVVTAPDGEAIDGPSLLGEKLLWRKAAHNGQLTLPDGQQVPLGLMSFAAPIKDKEGKSFFVMAAPSFWQEAGVESAELGLDKMLTGVFLHEFAHTRQMEGIGKRVDEVDRQHKFDMPLTDDIVQDHFKKDSVYVQLFRAETNVFYEAAIARTETNARMLARKGLELLKKRQANYLKGDKAILKELDDLFLTMEGLGQYTAIAWLTDPKGAAMSFEQAIKGFRRKKNQWSQEEGLALFLVLNRLRKIDWANDIFGKKPKSVIELLEKAVEKTK